MLRTNDQHRPRPRTEGVVLGLKQVGMFGGLKHEWMGQRIGAAASEYT